MLLAFYISDSFKNYMLSTYYYVSGIVLGHLEHMSITEPKSQSPCFHGVYILIGGTDIE